MLRNIASNGVILALMVGGASATLYPDSVCKRCGQVWEIGEDKRRSHVRDCCNVDCHSYRYSDCAKFPTLREYCPQTNVGRKLLKKEETKCRGCDRIFPTHRKFQNHVDKCTKVARCKHVHKTFLSERKSENIAHCIVSLVESPNGPESSSLWDTHHRHYFPDGNLPFPAGKSDFGKGGEKVNPMGPDHAREVAKAYQHKDSPAYLRRLRKINACTGKGDSSICVLEAGATVPDDASLDGTMIALHTLHKGSPK